MRSRLFARELDRGSGIAVSARDSRADGYNLNVAGRQRLSALVLHGGPGKDRSMFGPTSPARRRDRLLYVDEPGRVAPSRSTSRRSRSRSSPATRLLAETLALDGFLARTLVRRDHRDVSRHRARHRCRLVISGGHSSDALDADVAASLEALGARQGDATWGGSREPIQRSKSAATSSRATSTATPPGYVEQSVPSPEVLRHFANAGYGDLDYRSKLENVDKPTLVIVGEYDSRRPRGRPACSATNPGERAPRRPDAGHLSFVEQPDDYLAAVRDFLGRTAE